MDKRPAVLALSDNGRFFKEKACPSLLRRLILASEVYTETNPVFPVAIALRISESIYIYFRDPREDVEKTESTISAMVVAYDADELCVLYCSEINEGLKALAVSCSRGNEGAAIVFELAAESSRWVIGVPLVQMESKQFGWHIGKRAVDFFNETAERARLVEARKALEEWNPVYNWDFDNLIDIPRLRE